MEGGDQNVVNITCRTNNVGEYTIKVMFNLLYIPFPLDKISSNQFNSMYYTLEGRFCIAHTCTLACIDIG